MRLVYADMPLTGTPWQEDCGEVVWDGLQEALSEPLVRDLRYLEGLGGCSDLIPVRVRLDLGDSFAALDYVAKLLWQLPKQGELKFIAQLGTAQMTVTYPLAVFRTARRRISGESSVDVEYQFEVNAEPTTLIEGDVPRRLGTGDGAFILINP